jgi:hypothetical protein
MEQCTECGSYRARKAEGIAYVVPDQQGQQQEEVRQDNEDSLPDPEAEGGGSVWGPDSTTSSDNDSW